MTRDKNDSDCGIETKKQTPRQLKTSVSLLFSNSLMPLEVAKVNKTSMNLQPCNRLPLCSWSRSHTLPPYKVWTESHNMPRKLSVLFNLSATFQTESFCDLSNWIKVTGKWHDSVKLHGANRHTKDLTNTVSEEEATVKVLSGLG